LRSTNQCGFCRKHYRESEITLTKERQRRKDSKEYKRKYDLKYRKKNKDKIRKDKKRHYRKNKKRIKKRGKDYYNKNREKIIKRQKKYYLKNRAYILKYHKKYREKNKKLINKKIAKYRKKNKDKFKKYIKQYLKTKRGRSTRERGQRKRRATKLKVYENFLEEMVIATYLAFDDACFACRKKKDLCLDHFKPLSKGFALSLDNAIILCRSCNSKKRNKMPEDFFTKKQIKYAKKLMKDAVKIYKKIIKKVK